MHALAIKRRAGKRQGQSQVFARTGHHRVKEGAKSEAWRGPYVRWLGRDDGQWIAARFASPGNLHRSILKEDRSSHGRSWKLLSLVPRHPACTTTLSISLSLIACHQLSLSILANARCCTLAMGQVKSGSEAPIPLPCYCPTAYKLYLIYLPFNTIRIWWWFVAKCWRRCSRCCHQSPCLIGGGGERLVLARPKKILLPPIGNKCRWLSINFILS
jgi:hypothetical protein